MFRERLATRIQKVLERGMAERVFEASDPAETAARVVDAFSDYWLPLGFAEREPDQVMANAEALLKIILRGIAVHG
jgi:hypothetical protein